MSRNVHGGYDQAIFIDQQVASRLARFAFALDPVPRTGFGGTGPPAPDEQARGSYTLAARFAYLYLRQEPEVELKPWAERSARLIRPWNLETRDETDTVTLVIEVEASLSFTGLRTGSTWLDIQAQIDQEPDPQRKEAIRQDFTVPLRGYLRITDRVEPRRLVVHQDRADPSLTTEAWCAVIDFRPDTRRDHPEIRVWLDSSVTFAHLNAAVAALRLAGDTNLTLVADQIRAAVPARLAAISDWRMPDIGVVPLSITPLAGTERDPRDLVVRTVSMPETSSLLLLSRLTGPAGEAALAGRGNTVFQDTMQIVVAHQYLLRGLILPVLADGLGLHVDDFTPGVPVSLRAAVDLPGDDPPTRLLSLLLFVDEADTVRALLRFRIDDPAYTAEATADISIAFGATVLVRAGQPVLRIVPTITASSSVLYVRVAWWIAMLLGAGGVTGLLAPVVEHVISGQIVNRMNQELNQPADLIDTPIPGGVTFTVRSVSLRQPNAEPLLPSGLIRAHDLIITLDAAALPANLDVTCVTRDTVNPGGRLDAVGGLLNDGTPWGLSLDDAVAAIRSGTALTSVAPGGSRAPIEIVERDGQPPFLRTRADAQAENNLANLPECL